MLDFSLLGQGPTFENALRSYGQGKEMRRQSNVQNALLAHKDDPVAAAPDLIANGEIDQGLALQDRGRALKTEQTRKDVLGGYGADPATARTQAMGSGDMQLIAQVQQMDAQQRQMAAQNADELGSVAIALRQQPPEARKAALQSPQMQQWLASRGFKPEQIANFDPSDANLDAIAAQSMSVKELLEKQRLDHQTQFEQDKFEETKRHNKATEGVASQNADSRRISATKPRAGRSSYDFSSVSTEQLVAMAQGLAK